jgi:CubicO group peptidase (beta-lactamase class C family)
VTGALAGILVNDARLKPDAWVSDYIPELMDAPGFGGATVRQILDMTVAIVFSENYADPNAEVVAHEAATGWRGADAPMARDGVYAFARTIKKDDSRPHGTVFHYASINTDVLGWLIERASGQRFADFMSDAIWSRLGADHDGHISVDYRGSAVANGGFVLTLRDLARFSQMVLDDGSFNGRQIVKSLGVARVIRVVTIESMVHRRHRRQPTGPASQSIFVEEVLVLFREFGDHGTVNLCPLCRRCQSRVG